MKRTVALAIVVLMVPALAWGQVYPTKVITIIAASAGGPTDTVTRLVAQAMSKTLGQQIIVENVGGAGAPSAPPARPRPRPTATRRSCTTSAWPPPRALSQAALPLGRGLRAHRPRHRRADDAGGQEGLPGQGSEGAHRVREEEQGQGLLRQRRPWRGLAPVRHAVHERHRYGPHHGALQGHGPRDERPAGRAGRLHVRPDDEHHQPDQGREDQGVRRHDEDAGAVAAGCRRCTRRGCRTSRSPSGTGSTRPGDPKAVVEKLAAALQEALKDNLVRTRFAELGTEPVPAERARPDALRKHLAAELEKWGPIIKKAGVYAD